MAETKKSQKTVQVKGEMRCKNSLERNTRRMLLGLTPVKALIDLDEGMTVGVQLRNQGEWPAMGIGKEESDLVRWNTLLV